MGVFIGDDIKKHNGTNSGVNNQDVEVEDDGQIINENNTYIMNSVDLPINSLIMMLLVFVIVIAIITLIVVAITKCYKK